MFQVSEQNLARQARAIKSNRYLSDVELEFKRQIVQETERLDEGKEERGNEQGGVQLPQVVGLNDDVSERHEESPAQSEEENNQQENHTYPVKDVEELTENQKEPLEGIKKAVEEGE